MGAVPSGAMDLRVHSGTAPESAQDEGLPSARSLRELIEGTGEILFRYQVRPTPRLVEVSPAVSSLLGRTPEQLLRLNDPAALIHPTDQARLLRLAPSLLERPQAFAARLQTVSGGSVWAEVRTHPITSPDGHQVWVEGLIRDATASHAAMEQLRENELRSRKLLELASTVVCVMDPRGDFRYVSPGASRVFGVSAEETRLFERVHPDDRQRVRLQVAEITAHPWSVTTTGFRFRRGDGGWRVLETVFYNHLSDPALNGIVVAAQDITERHEAEAALRRSESYHRDLVTHFPGAIAVHRAEEIVFANPSLTALTGCTGEELLGRSFVELVPEEDRAALREKLTSLVRDGQVWKWEGRLRRKDGSLVLVDVTTLPFAHEGSPAVLSFLRDVTEAKRVQQQLMLADRMSAVGTLAGGVAHEINNPLAYIIGNLAFVQDQLARLGEAAVGGTSWPEIFAAVRDSREGLDRVRRIVRDLRTIARPEEQRGPVDVRRLLDSCLNLAWIESRQTAHLVKDFDDVPAVDGNEARLSQVFLNLVMNALEAMPPGRSRPNELKVSVRALPGSVEVAISDTGVGIPPEVLPRVFDPFFSTKAGGIGTGLGLPICHSVVTSLGGTIHAVSSPGEGTTVVVTLPARQSSALPASGGARRGRLLLLNGTDAIEESSRWALGSRHEVESVASGAEALSKLQSVTYDLILCGWPTHADAYEAIVSAHPGLRSRFFMLSRALPNARPVPPGIKGVSYQTRVELDVLLPALREVLEPSA